MAVATYKASAPAAKGGDGSGKNSKTLGIVIGVLALAALTYVGYKYVYLPAQERKRQNEEQQD